MEGDFLFLCEPLPFQGIRGWDRWLDRAGRVDPKNCLLLFDQPEPILTTAYKAALMTLRHQGWEADISDKDGERFCYYRSPSADIWQQIRLPAYRSSTRHTLRICADLLDGTTVYVKYHAPQHRGLADPLWEYNSLKLVSRGGRLYDRFWRGWTNDRWIWHGHCDLKQNIDTINPKVHIDVFNSEYMAIQFVASWLEEARLHYGEI
jgi:hypothetical protein